MMRWKCSSSLAWSGHDYISKLSSVIESDLFPTKQESWPIPYQARIMTRPSKNVTDDDSNCGLKVKLCFLNPNHSSSNASCHITIDKAINFLSSEPQENLLCIK